MINSLSNVNYQIIARSIDYIKINYRNQPSLEKLAENANLSLFHFQRLFTEWAGVSPKRFLQYININNAKLILRAEQATLFDAAYALGMSGTGRLHDLFIKIEGMTPGEYKNGGEYLTINYHFDTSPFGNILIASTSKGICHLSFVEKSEESLNALKKEFPKANFNARVDPSLLNTTKIFSNTNDSLQEIKLHLKGTAFQIKVWEALLKIPFGNITSYSKVAESIQNPKASRAVGTAIGNNPIAYLIPCHRVIQGTGEYGNYMWGNSRKVAMIGWEGVRKLSE